MELNNKSTIKLNNEIEMPILGLGTWDLRSNECYKAVKIAIDLGYRLIDTASLYGNEESIGNALKESNINREELFITTKVWNNDHGYKKTLKAFDKSLNRLKLSYVDLYLIHWPVSGLRNDTWKALEKLYNEGKTRAIGISNYTIRHIEELLLTAKTVPMVNQVELSPFLYQENLIKYCHNKEIRIEAYSPLTRGRRFNNRALKAISKKHNKSVAQILIRWGLQHRIIEIPKSGNKAHLQENIEVFDFHLDKDDMNELDNLNEDFRMVDDPDKYD